LFLNSFLRHRSNERCELYSLFLRRQLIREFHQLFDHKDCGH
jgi:hypothetical protein